MNAEKIYHTYFMQVYSFVMNIVKDPGLAEEITQSTFFKAMTAKSDFKKEAAESMHSDKKHNHLLTL